MSKPHWFQVPEGIESTQDLFDLVQLQMFTSFQGKKFTDQNLALAKNLYRFSTKEFLPIFVEGLQEIDEEAKTGEVFRLQTTDYIFRYETLYTFSKYNVEWQEFQQ